MWRFFKTKDKKAVYYRVECEEKKVLSAQQWIHKWGGWNQEAWADIIVAKSAELDEFVSCNEVSIDSLPLGAQEMHEAMLRKYTVVFVDHESWQVEQVTVSHPADVERVASDQREAKGWDLGAIHIIVFEGHIKPVLR